MKYCEKCKVSVRGESSCPLCQNELSGNYGDTEHSVFPEIPTVYAQHKPLFKWLIFLTLSAGIISIAVNAALPETGYWWIYAIFGLACFWISLVTVLKRHGNLFSMITLHVFVLSILSVALDFIMLWSNWSLDFFIPTACSGGLVSLAIISVVRKVPAEDYVMYLISSLLFCAVQTVLFFSGLITIALPSIICIALSLITLVFLVVFEGKNLLGEIGKRFHI